MIQRNYVACNSSLAYGGRIPYNRIRKTSSVILPMVQRRYHSASSSDGVSESPETELANLKVNETNNELSTQTIKKILYSEVCDMNNLLKGLDLCKPNKSPGLDGISTKDLSEGRIKKLQNDLICQRYQPKPNKKVAIPKPGGGVRYLGIASAVDKVVQGTLLNLLSPIVEPLFSYHSYGFRPGMGCHNALKTIRHK